MASSPPHSAVVLLLLLIAVSDITASETPTGSTTTSHELDTTLEALRNHGRTLFTNAITTSDLRLQILSTFSAYEPTSQFTLFAPRNEPLSALDMVADAASYVSTLRYHVVPFRRLTFSDLQNLSSPFLDTLLPHYSVLIGRTLDVGALPNNRSTGIMVDGVRVSDPDLFIGSRIAVHGIEGILLTGLNINHQDFDGNGSGSFLSPAEAPVAPSYGFSPTDGSSTPTPQFDWNNVPVHPAPQPAGNIPVEIPPVMPPERMRSIGKKRHGKRHRKHRVHRRHKGHVHHRVFDL